MEKAFIVHIKSHHREGYKTYSSVGRAKAAMKRAKRWDKVTPKYPTEEYAVMTVSEYQAANIMVETYNMLDPERRVIMIPRSEKGTHMDPATERYHAM